MRWKAVVAAVLIWSMAVGTPARADSVRPPVVATDFPDPHLVAAGPYWYLFGTNATNRGNVPVARSPDLDSWQLVGDALPTLGTWARAGFTWAPAVARIGASWTLYYTARDQASDRQCIGRAVATSPTGPYVDRSPAAMVCQLDRGGSIDPDLYRDQSGTWWLTWKSDDNAVGRPPHLWSQRLSANGSERVGPVYDLLAADQPWENGIIEGPSMIDRGDHVLLFYGTGWWESWEPSIGYAVCQSPAGPCTKQRGPWMSTETARVAAPSGPSLARSSNGTTVLAFQSWVGAIGYGQGGQRMPSIEPLDLSGPVPRLRPDRPRGGPIDPDLLWLARSSLSGGTPDVVVEYGGAVNDPVAGDWNGDGTTDVGVYDNGWWYLRNSLTPGPPDHAINYGAPGYQPITGSWSGGADSIAVVVPH